MLGGIGFIESNKAEINFKLLEAEERRREAQKRR